MGNYIECQGIRLNKVDRVNGIYYTDDRHGSMSESSGFNVVWYTGQVADGKCKGQGMLTYASTNDNSPVNISNDTGTIFNGIDIMIDHSSRPIIPIMQSRRGV